MQVFTSAAVQNEDEELWQPYPRDALGPHFVPMPAHVLACFRQQCKLCTSLLSFSAFALITPTHT